MLSSQTEKFIFSPLSGLKELTDNLGDIEFRQESDRNQTAESVGINADKFKHLTTLWQRKKYIAVKTTQNAVK